MKLEDRVALVTGAAQGIGRAISAEMAREGALVVMADIKADRLKESFQSDIAEVYVDKHVNGRYIVLDVTDERQIKASVNEIVEGLGRIDILVNCAGVLSSFPIVELEENEWDRILNVNLKGTFLTTKIVMRHMMDRRQGRIINIASDSGITGKKFLSHYCSSKFGVIGFTQSAAKEGAEFNITVNAICPGPTVTEIYQTDRDMQSRIRGISKDALIAEENKQIPLGRPAQPNEIARMAVFLASDSGSYITGEAINISGGLEVH
jgi:NAD(P)-dependent dehydrogenase (short-subunit alcohol dehydrogenase family)